MCACCLSGNSLPSHAICALVGLESILQQALRLVHSALVTFYLQIYGGHYRSLITGKPHANILYKYSRQYKIPLNKLPQVIRHAAGCEGVHEFGLGGAGKQGSRETGEQGHRGFQGRPGGRDRGGIAFIPNSLLLTLILT